MGGRRTNLALLGLLAASFLTGWLAFSFNGWSSRVTLVVHGLAGLAIVGLLPWKALIARRSILRRGGAGWVMGGTLALLLVTSITFGLLHSGGQPFLWATPLLSSVPMLRELTAMELHVGAALALLPFAIWHVLVRPVRARPTDLSRRVVLRLALLLAAAAAGLAGLPAGRRGLTRSYRLGSPSVASRPVGPVSAGALAVRSLLVAP